MGSVQGLSVHIHEQPNSSTHTRTHTHSHTHNKHMHQTFSAMESNDASDDSGVSVIDHGVSINVHDEDPHIGTKSRPSLAEVHITGVLDGATDIHPSTFCGCVLHVDF